MPSTNYLAEITYARVNANNTALASSNDGNGNGAAITEVIAAPTHSTLTVSGTPSGTTVVASATVAGIFEAGQYLFYWDASANPILIGQIASISTSTITLVGTILGTGGDMTNRELGVSYSLVTGNEQFYIRVKTSKTSTTTGFILMPNFQTWRVNPTQREQSTIRTTQSKIERYSQIGTPVSFASPIVGVNFRIQTVNNFLSSNNGLTFFANWSQFPQYIWLLATIIPSDATSSALLQSTMYRFTTNEFMDLAITVTANTANATLRDAGYSVTEVAAGSGNLGGSSTGGGVN
jgi:hypothetical protein